MLNPQAPPDKWFIVQWDEGPDDCVHALYERCGDRLRWHIDEDGEVADELLPVADWHPSCVFAPLTRDEVDACFAVTSLNPAAWPACAEQLVSERLTPTQS